MREIQCGRRVSFAGLEDGGALSQEMQAASRRGGWPVADSQQGTSVLQIEGSEFCQRTE